jgi:extracellular solute-binding protein (family 3)
MRARCRRRSEAGHRYNDRRFGLEPPCLLHQSRRDMLFGGIDREDIMKWLVPAAMAALLLAPMGPAAADRLDDVKARGRVIVGISETTPPFSFKTDGKIVGYDIDLVHAVAKCLGVAVEMVGVSSADRIPMLKDGKLDFVATSMTRTPEPSSSRRRAASPQYASWPAKKRHPPAPRPPAPISRRPSPGSSWSMCATIPRPSAC